MPTLVFGAWHVAIPWAKTAVPTSLRKNQLPFAAATGMDKLNSSLEATGAMDYRTFEQKLLDTIFTTDDPLNPATIAFLYKLTVQQASDLLQQAAVNGLLNIESDEDGNLLYTYPNRVRLPRESRTDARRDLLQGRVPTTALVPSGPSAKLGPTDLVPLPDSIDLIEASTPRNDGKNATSALGPDSPSSSSSSSSAASTSQTATGTTRCRFCNEVVLVGAKKCKHCHEFLDDAWREIQNLKQPAAPRPPQTAVVPMQPPGQLQQWTNTNATQAALLSFFVPGLGQMVSGRVPAGLLWMMFTCLGYLCFVVPGIVLHILCVINATRPQQPVTQ